MEQRTYLGDSVYARFDGEQVWIYTDNGYGPNQVREIALNADTLEALGRFVERAATAADARLV